MRLATPLLPNHKLFRDEPRGKKSKPVLPTATESCSDGQLSRLGQAGADSATGLIIVAAGVRRT